MMVLITYDVSTQTPEGQRRLRRIAAKCSDKGQRVQNSVFECEVDYAQYQILKHELAEMIDTEADSLRFYNLGKNYKNRIVHIGAKQSYDPNGLLFV